MKSNAENAYSAFRKRAGGMPWSELPDADKADWEAVVSAFPCPQSANMATVAKTGAFIDHDLKIDPERLAEILLGTKTHEIRVFDRDYQVGHTLRLEAYDRSAKAYTGQSVMVKVTNITAPGCYGLPENVGVMSISLVSSADDRPKAVMPTIDRQVGALDDECEKYLAEQNLYSVADQLDETDPVDIFTTDGDPVLIQIPKDISVYYLMMLINHGRQQYARGSTARQAKSATPELQNPVAVINTMQSRIGQLERQLQMERAAAQDKYEQVVNDAVRRLRLHGVIPLYVGVEDFDKVRSDVCQSSPLLVSALEQAWLLQSAPVPEAAKSALFSAANHGMNRW